jgi:NADH:ubiquinone oxidoreductase subunit 6 (subunit J)
MSEFLSHGLVPIAIGAVAVVLLFGLVNMMRGGSGNTSQKLMRLRVLLQFVAIVIIMVTIWVMAKYRSHGQVKLAK